MAKKHFNDLNQYLDDDLATFSRENHFAAYGYLFAHFDLGLLTIDEFETLRQRLDLSVEDIDDLLL